MPAHSSAGKSGSVSFFGAGATSVSPFLDFWRTAFGCVNRARFSLASLLADIPDPGDGDVARAIRAVQRRHFDPPETDERAQPHSRAWARAR
jgi:hypothetical protein